MFPKSFFEAMATNEILQILVFSLFFGFALTALKDKPAVTVTKFIDELAHAMLKLTEYVMLFAPMGVFGAVAAAITTQGIGMLATYGKFIGTFYASLVVLWAVLIAAGFVFLGPARVRADEVGARADADRVHDGEQRGRVPEAHGTARPLRRQRARHRADAAARLFVQPRRLDGVPGVRRAVHRAGVRHRDVVGQQVTLLLVMMLSSKGVAGVPRASLVVVAAVLPMFGLPEAGLLLIMGIDQFLDMGRTATNVIGNGIATAVVAKWEGALGPPLSENADVLAITPAGDDGGMMPAVRSLVVLALACASALAAAAPIAGAGLGGRAVRRGCSASRTRASSVSATATARSRSRTSARTASRSAIRSTSATRSSRRWPRTSAFPRCAPSTCA